MILIEYRMVAGGPEGSKPDLPSQSLLKLTVARPTEPRKEHIAMTMPTRILGTLAVAAVALLSGGARAEAPKKTPELVAKGQASYQINCAACHGDKGAGDGVAAAALNPKPRNLATAEYKNGAQPAQVFATLEKGVPGTAMVSFGHLPVDERWALTYYVLEMRGGKKK